MVDMAGQVGMLNKNNNAKMGFVVKKRKKKYAPYLQSLTLFHLYHFQSLFLGYVL
jgi:hypothetical protein